MTLLRFPALCLSAAFVLSAAAPHAQALRTGRYTLNPKTYTSPSGEYELRVDPSTIYGQGEGSYRMTRRGAEVWAGKLPFTLWDAAVADDGTVAGYAYSLGMENRPLDRTRSEGKLHLVILDSKGAPRMNATSPRRGMFTCTSTVDRNVRGFVFDPENDRFIARLQEGGVLSGGETWQVYQVSQGVLQDEFTFAHPRESERDHWYLLGARAVAGTPLVLVNWEYTRWDEKGNQVRAAGGSFNLVDAAGKPVWELVRPDDYPEYYEYSQRLDAEKDQAEIERLRRLEREIREKSAILRTDQPRQFEVWFVKDSRRVTFNVDTGGPSGWQVTEQERAEMRPAAPEVEEERGEKLDALALRHVGTITLQADAPPAPEIRAIEHFDVDEKGRIGFLRHEKDRSTTFVLLDALGNVLQSVSLKATFGGDSNIPSVTWIAGERWLLRAQTWQKGSGGGAITRAWWLHAQTGQLDEISPFPAQGARRVAATRDGGFVAAVSPRSGTEQRDELVAFDADGKERWRAAPGDVILGVTVTTQGRIIAQHGYGERTLSVTTLAGRVLETRTCGELFGKDRVYLDYVTADAEGGLVLVFGRPPRVWRINPDWTVREKLDPRYADGRAVDPATGPDDAALRVERDGTLWMCDRHSFLRLKPDGRVDRVLGEPVDAPVLRRVGGVAIDQHGHIYVAEERNGTTHVFDASGRRTRMLRPNPRDFEDAWGLSVDVAGDGSVFVSGLEFSPDGARVGFRQLPSEQEEPWPFGGRVCHQPHSRRYWIISSEDAALVGEDNKILRTVQRCPDGNWLDRVEASAVAPDGSLALAAGPSGVGVYWQRERHTINLYSPSGDPLKTIELPKVGPTQFRVDWLVYSGRYVVMEPWGGEAPRYLLGDAGAEPPKWYDLGALDPYADNWRHFIVKDGRELWMFAEGARKIERFEVPATGASKPADTQPAQSGATGQGGTGPVAPVLYAPRFAGFGHAPLSGEQIATILRKAADCAPAGRNVWFIYALANWDVNGRREGAVQVFFSPSTQTPRVRKGAFLRMTARPLSVDAEFQDAGATTSALLRGPGLGPTEEYWQVSAGDEPFGDLEIPTAALVPFVRPEGLAEDEVVRLVDFVRSAPRTPASLNGAPVPDGVAGSLPIVSIERKGDAIEIRTGTQEGPLSGAGEWLRIRKTEDGAFELLEAGRWVS